MSETTLWLLCSGFNFLCLIVNAWMVITIKKLSEDAVDVLVDLLKKMDNKSQDK